MVSVVSTVMSAVVHTTMVHSTVVHTTVVHWSVVVMGSSEADIGRCSHLNVRRAAYSISCSLVPP